MAAAAWFGLALASFAWVTVESNGPWLQPEVLLATMLLARMLGGRTALLVLLPLMLGLLAASRQLPDRLPASLAGQDILVTGQICDFPREQGDAVRFTLVTRNQAGLPRSLHLTWYRSPVSLSAGQHWQLKLRLRPPRGSSNPGAMDSERYWFAGRIGGRGYIRDSPLNQLMAADVSLCPAIRLRQSVAAAVERALGSHPRTGHLLAVTVAARHRLDPADWDLLRATGTAHLLAISGLHVGLLAGIGLLAGTAVGRWLVRVGAPVVPVTVGRVLAVVLAAGYASLAGFSVPTVRALVMVLAGVAAAALGRMGSGWRPLTVAMVAVLAIEPLASLTAGFWLSFGAVACLLVPGQISHLHARTGTVAARIRQLGVAQWRLTIGLAPLGLLIFGQYPLVSPLANLFAIPVFSMLVIPPALVGVALSPAGLGDWPLQLSAYCLDWLLRGLAAVAEFAGAGWMPVRRAGWVYAAAFTAVVILLLPRPLPGRWLALLFMLPLVLGGPVSLAPGVVRVVVMDVGQGLAVLVQTGNKSLLYDTGPAWRRTDAGAVIVAPVLRHYGVRQLDALVVSHGDADHAGGVRSILDSFPVVRMQAPADALPGLSYRDCRAGQGWSWHGVAFEFLHPPPGRLPASDNDQSCVLLVTAPGFRVLLPGDISARTESAMLRRRPDLAVNVVIAPHHGSASSSGPGLVAATRPDYVVFSTGHANRWGFPRDRVVARWRSVGACLVDTALHGAITLTWSPAGGIQVSRHRTDKPRIWSYGARTPACMDDALL